MTAQTSPHTTRDEFQQILTRLAKNRMGEAGASASDIARLVDYAKTLNAVLIWSSKVFLAQGDVIETPERAILALALLNADPGIFTFRESCTCAWRMCRHSERSAFVEGCYALAHGASVTVRYRRKRRWWVRLMAHP